MTPKQKYYENISNTIIENLKKRQIDGFYCPDKETALAKVLELMPEGSTIGYGGSVTLAETGIMDAIKQDKYQMIDRDAYTNAEEQRVINGKIAMADFFLMSSNAITVNGELINIDGRGNRVSYLCWGPQNVIVVVGMNKIVTDVEEGIKRVRNIAAPPNTVRLKKDTPCAVTGKCGDCFAPGCICSQLVVTRRSGTPGRIKIVLVGEELGY